MEKPGSVPRMNYFGTSPRESAPATIALKSLRSSINAATNEVKKKNLSGVPERGKIFIVRFRFRNTPVS
jgi:hypothetical protein